MRRDRLPSRAHPVRVGARGAWFATVLTVFIVDFDDGEGVPRPWDQWDQRNFATDSGAHEEVIVKQEDLAEVNHVAAREALRDDADHYTRRDKENPRGVKSKVAGKTLRAEPRGCVGGWGPGGP